MTINQSAEVACPVCASGDSKPLFWTKDYVFGCSDQMFRLNRCTGCGCGYLSPRPSRDAISAYYPREFYWSWEGENDSMSWSAIVDKRRRQLDAKAKWLSDLTPGRLLDIGAQKGEFLWLMRQQGWLVEGVELDPGVPNPAQMPIRFGDFLEMDFEAGVYDAITFWAVLEHVYEPARFMDKASRLLKPGGRIIAVVTNLNSIQSRFYQADDYPRHLTIFTKKSVQQLCSSAGLKAMRFVTDQKIFGGSLSGALLYLFKRLFGYTSVQALTEWKQLKEPDLFWCQWRGKNSWWVKNVSRIDRLLTYPVEKLLDRLGFGLTLSFAAEKP